MRAAWALAAVPLLILLLTWLSLRAINSNAELFDRLLGEMDHQAMVQAGLHRDVLSVRAGLLRNYDPLVQEEDAITASLARLRVAAAADPAAAARIARLAAALDREATLVEQFKTDNALLQNSLAHFELFAGRLGTADPAGPVAPAVGALAGAMLRLTLDTSPATAREVESELANFARQPVSAGEASVAEALLAHGRMLHDLLPAVDGILRALAVTPWQQDWQSLRAVVLTDQAASRMTARRFRVTLYAASLLLVGCLVHLAVRLRSRASALRRRAAFEHVIAGISMRFLAAHRLELGASIERALADLAACIGADRAYFLLGGASARQHTWPAAGFPPGWPERAAALAARSGWGGGEVLLIADVARLRPGEVRDQCRALGLRGWICAVRATGDNACAVLGFDMLHRPCRITQSGGLGLMRMALDTILNATTREFLEHDKSRLEARLEQARRMETVGAFASGVAHNFNNILAAILGYTEFAEEQAAAAAPRHLAEIRRAAERARVLVEQILSFGRRRDSRRHQVSVHDLVAEAGSLLRASLPPDIELVLRPPAQPLALLGEPAQLLQVFLNLGNNAAQAMDGAGRLEIAADLRRLAGAQPLSHGELACGCYARIAVTDTGRGIDPAALSRLFEPFFTTRRAGNGLGLATAREIVREHGGAMHVENSPGAGSRFEVWLPCITAPLPPAQAPALSRGGGQTILMVEAEREWLIRHEEMLAALGYEPVGFMIAADALMAHRREPDRFDMMFVGHLVPAVAGLELAAALHRIEPGLPILLAAASAEEIEVDALLAAGVSDVVHWPINPGEIAAALKSIMPAAVQTASV